MQQNRTHESQAILDRLLNAEAVPPGELGRDVDVLARQAALTDSLARLFLVGVGLRSIWGKTEFGMRASRGCVVRRTDMREADRDRLVDPCRRLLAPPERPRPVRDAGNAGAYSRPFMSSVSANTKLRSVERHGWPLTVVELDEVPRHCGD